MDDVWSPKVHLQHCQYYKNVWEGKTYNASDARRVDFPKFGGRGALMMVGISGGGQGVSQLLQAVYTKP